MTSIPNSFPPDHSNGMITNTSRNSHHGEQRIEQDDSPLTPVEDIPLISNDWNSSDDVLDSSKSSNYKDQHNSSDRDSYGVDGSPWKSNIDIQSQRSSKLSFGTRTDTKGNSIDNDIGSFEFKLSSSTSNSISGMGRSYPHANGFVRHRLKSRDGSMMIDYNTNSADKTTSIDTSQLPHPHYRLFQQRMNKLVFNVEHLSLIYRHKLYNR